MVEENTEECQSCSKGMSTTQKGMVFLSFYILMNSIIKRVIKSYLEEKEQNNSKGKRKMSKSYCEKTPCKNMGFSQKASCRPYKNCYK